MIGRALKRFMVRNGEQEIVVGLTAGGTECRCHRGARSNRRGWQDRRDDGALCC